MEVLSIAIASHASEVKDRFQFEFKLLKEEGLNVTVDEHQLGNTILFRCNIPDKQLLDSSFKNKIGTFRNHIANALSDCFINQWEQDIIRKIIKVYYYYIKEEDQLFIYNNTIKMLNTDNRNGRRDYLNPIFRKSRIQYKLLEYLEGNSDIIIDGFINFRLKEYIEELKDAVAKSFDDYMMEKEYREFLRLLKYFVDIQETIIETVHVLTEGNNFKLLDGNMEIINQEYFDEFLTDLKDGELNYEDLLISTLITIAPQKVILHISVERAKTEVFRTIQNVFTDRVTLCKGCENCLSLKAIKNKIET